MRRLMGAKKQECKALILCVSMMLVFLWGCNQGGGSSKKGISPSQAASTTSKGMIDITGGALSVETDTGLIVMVDIPADALDYSREITLSVDEDEEAGEITIAVDPSISLAGPAALTVLFPDESACGGLIVSRKKSGTPLKQGMSEGKINAPLYRFGEFSVKLPDEDALYDAYIGMIDTSPDGSWQGAYETFDALIWLSDYFSRQGLTGEALACFAEMMSKSKESVDLFLGSLEKAEKGSQGFVALQKYKNLMTLCENPDQIVSTLDILLGKDDQG